MSRLFQNSKPRSVTPPNIGTPCFRRSPVKQQRHGETGSATIHRIDRQTPEFLAAVEREKHRAKLAQNGEDIQ